MKTELGKKLRSLSGVLCGLSLVHLGIYFLSHDDKFYIIGGITLSVGIALWIVSLDEM